MYSIKVEANFSSAHNLRGYKGKCEELHGHNWKVEVAVAKNKLDKLGMVADFRLIKDRVEYSLGKTWTINTSTISLILKKSIRLRRILPSTYMIALRLRSQVLSR